MPEGKSPAPNPVKSGGSVGGKHGCQAAGCKSDPAKLEFCVEHFKQYKFGLITKKGVPVSDYEKKVEHYQKWLKTQPDKAVA